MSSVDHLGPHVPVGATGLLGTFAGADVLTSADVHAAEVLGTVGVEADERVRLAAALAVRAVRLGHVYADLATVASTVATEDGAAGLETDLSSLPWPEPADWCAAVAASPFTAVGEQGADDRPLRLVGSRLYLDRYWRHERAIVADLLGRAAAAAPDVDAARVDDGIRRLLATDEHQAAAARAAVTRGLAVVAGGPGTGKTTTVARLLALILEQAAAAGGPPPRIALAAPTGKAAARLAEAVHAEAPRLDTTDDVRAVLASLTASTLHRLLGWRPGSRSRFRHDATNRLPHTVVVVDETSMVSLSMMATLLAAVRPTARLVLVGDPRQLASVEAGAVLGDVVGPPGVRGPLDDAVVHLRTTHRYGTAIGAVAAAIESGDADGAVEALRAGGSVTWIDQEVTDPTHEPALAEVQALAVAAGRTVVGRAVAGDAAGALAALRSVQVLCAHRRGPTGAATWRAAMERWLRHAVPGWSTGGRHAGQAVLVLENDAGLGVFNGDTGVLVDTGGGRLRVAFDRSGGPLLVSPNRLESVEALSAMTIHKAQGSQFGTAVVAVPGPASRALTRELLYTGITRAQDRLVLVASEASVRAAVDRPIARASGIRDAIWSTP